MSFKLCATPISSSHSCRPCYTPGSPQYRQFLTPEQFRARFGPSARRRSRAVSRRVRGRGGAYGHTDRDRAAARQRHRRRSSRRNLGCSCTRFQVTATAETPALRLSHAAERAAAAGRRRRLGARRARARYPPASDAAPARRASGPGSGRPAPAAQTNTPDPPGSGRCIDYADTTTSTRSTSRDSTGRATHSRSSPSPPSRQSDAYYYWNAVGLKVQSNRIKEVNVDGGSGAPSDAGGSTRPRSTLSSPAGSRPARRSSSTRPPIPTRDSSMRSRRRSTPTVPTRSR